MALASILAGLEVEGGALGPRQNLGAWQERRQLAAAPAIALARQVKIFDALRPNVGVRAQTAALSEAI